MPTSDGYQWVAQIERGAIDELLPAYHALPMYTLFLLQRGLAAAGIPVPTLALIQAVNGLLAAAGAVLLYATVVAVGGGAALGLVGGALLAASFAYWYFANGELHHFALVILQAIFLAIARARARGAPLSRRAVAGLGAVNAVAVLFHQESFLFGFAAVALLMVGRPLRAGLRDAAVYAAAGSASTAALAVLVGAGVRGTRTLDGFLRWFLWVLYGIGEPQPYALGNAFTAFARMLKGQLTALIFGTQAVADAARDPALLRAWPVPLVVALTAAAWAIAAVLLAALWRRRRSLGPALGVAAAGSAAWLASYKLLLHWWFWPTAPEYHISTLPPLILLLLAGPIAARAEGTAAGRVPPRWAIAAPLSLLALVAGVDLATAIRPWLRYGDMKDALAADARRAFGPGDLFVSSESGIDPVLTPFGRHLRVKDLLRGTPAPEGLAEIRAAIAAQLAGGGRVFVYNLVPSPYTLLGLNQSPVRQRDGPLTTVLFEDFLRELGRAYALVPVAPYWEESKEPLYLFGRRLEWIWQVKPRAP